MKRRNFLLNTGMAGILASGLAPAVHAQPLIRWRLASSFPKSLDTLFAASEVFSKMVSDATNGQFRISLHPGGELVPPFGVLDAVQNATVECCHTAPYYFFGKDDTFAIDCAIPFGLTSRQMTAWMYEGQGLKLLREFYAQYNIVNFPMGNTGAQMGGWYRKPVHGLADMKGLKMRIGGFGGKVLSAIGGVPQNLPAGEIYQALEKGVIDASEWIGPYDDEKLGLYKVAKYYYYPGWWEPSAQTSLYINSKAWQSLSGEFKAIVQAAASHAHVDMQAKYDAKNPAALKKLVASGAKIVSFDKSIIKAAFEASNQIYQDLSKSNPNWKKIYANYSTFRDEQRLWHRIAEVHPDQFI